MEKMERKRLRLENFDYSQNGAYFVTVCTKNRKAILSRVLVGQAALSLPEACSVLVELTDIGMLCQKYIEKIPAVYSGVWVDAYVIMPNHIHILLRFEDGSCPGGLGAGHPTVSSVIRSVKVLVTKELGYPIWQKSFHDHVIRNETDYQMIWQYIENNPLQWELDELYTEERE